MIIDKSNKELWDCKDSTELDDMSYAIYCDSMTKLWGGFDSIIYDPIPQSHFIKDGNHLYCFYRMAKHELRLKKLNKIQYKIEK